MALPTLETAERLRLAGELGINPMTLYQITRGLTHAGPALARRINDLDPRFSLQDLRPTDWHLIWPELAEAR